MTEISKKLVSELNKRGLTISTAESCTGGLIAKCITDVSGASNVFYGGVVSYDNSVKENVLGVKHQTLESYGAVSSQTAEQMAMGVKELLKTDIGISTTGIAGPLGGTPEKPVGTVYIGIATEFGVDTARLNISPDYTREQIREETVKIILKTTLDKIYQNY